jgi:hypothetical protein
MKNKIKFYFTRALLDGMLFALALVNTTHAFVDKRGWFSCAIWILLTLFWIGIIYMDFRNATKIVNEADKVEPEDTSILGAQLYGKAKLEKKKQDDDLDIKILHDLEKKKR